MAASDLEPLFAEAAKQRQGARNDLKPNFPADLPEGNRREREAREQAAKAVGAKGRNVSQAKGCAAGS